MGGEQEWAASGLLSVRRISLLRVLSRGYPWLTLLCCVASAGCESDGWVAHHIEDQGDVSFHAQIDQAGAKTVQVEVELEACLQTSCTEWNEESCTAVRDGDEIRVSVVFDWETRETKKTCVTDDCHSLNALCTMPWFPPGTYTVKQGDTTAMLRWSGDDSP